MIKANRTVYTPRNATPNYSKEQKYTPQYEACVRLLIREQYKRRVQKSIGRYVFIM